MGQTAARLSDYVIVTSDNPRTEAPMDIINEILPGVKNAVLPLLLLKTDAMRYGTQ